jgi:hypothetical protein
MIKQVIIRCLSGKEREEILDRNDIIRDMMQNGNVINQVKSINKNIIKVKKKDDKLSRIKVICQTGQVSNIGKSSTEPGN